MDGIKLLVSTEIYFQSCFFSKVLTLARAYSLKSFKLVFFL